MDQLFILSLVSSMVVISTGQTSISFQVRAIGSHTEVGEDATLQCFNTYGSPNNISEMILSISEGTTKYVEYDMLSESVIQEPSWINPRYSFDPSMHSIVISDVECGDEKKLTCRLSGSLESSGGGFGYSTNGSIYVKVPPKAPKAMVTNPVNLTNGININSVLNTTCNANTGRPGIGKIQWRMTVGNNNPKYVSSDDPRVSAKKVPLEDGDLSCTERSESTLTIKAGPKVGDEIVIACFVENRDYSQTYPVTCGPTEYCLQSASIKILENPDDNDDNTALIIGGVAGGVIVLVVIIAIIFLLLRKGSKSL